MHQLVRCCPTPGEALSEGLACHHLLVDDFVPGLTVQNGIARLQIRLSRAPEPRLDYGVKAFILICFDAASWLVARRIPLLDVEDTAGMGSADTSRRAQPGKYNIRSYGAGTSSHIQGVLVNMQAELELVHVPFQGAAPLLPNLIGGQLSSAFIDSASARPPLANFRPLAVTGTSRMPGLPDVPTFAEPGYQSFDPDGWFGMFLPAGVPAAITSKLSDEVNHILRVHKLRAIRLLQCSRS